MKKWLVSLIMVLSVVCFSTEWKVLSMGEDIYSEKNHSNPIVAILQNSKTDKYTLARCTASPHGLMVEKGSIITEEDFKIPIVGFSAKYPEGYDTGLRSIVLLKHNGKTYKELTYDQIIFVLKKLQYKEYNEF